MEDINISTLHGNSLDLYALHYFIMQEHLIGFKNGWANHSLRTEYNKTPIQLWVMGYLDMDESESSSAVQSTICHVCFFYTYCMFYMIHKNGQALTIPAM